MKQRFSNSSWAVKQDDVQVLLLRPSFTKQEMLKTFIEFFQQYANMHPMYSMLYVENLGLCDYVLFE